MMPRKSTRIKTVAEFADRCQVCYRRSTHCYESSLGEVVCIECITATAQDC